MTKVASGPLTWQWCQTLASNTMFMGFSSRADRVAHVDGYDLITFFDATSKRTRSVIPACDASSASAIAASADSS